MDCRGSGPDGAAPRGALRRPREPRPSHRAMARREFHRLSAPASHVAPMARRPEREASGAIPSARPCHGRGYRRPGRQSGSGTTHSASSGRTPALRASGAAAGRNPSSAEDRIARHPPAGCWCLGFGPLDSYHRFGPGRRLVNLGREDNCGASQRFPPHRGPRAEIGAGGRWERACIRRPPAPISAAPAPLPQPMSPPAALARRRCHGRRTYAACGFLGASSGRVLTSILRGTLFSATGAMISSRPFL